MYKIIGGDGREYGPVSADQLRKWIADGRATGETRVQLEGSADWKPLKELVEFAEAVGTKSPTPSSSSSPPPHRDPMQGDFQLDISSCFGRSWQLLKTNFALVVGSTALILIILVLLGWTQIGWIISGPFLGGLALLYLKLIRNQPATLGDAFSGFSVAGLHLFLGWLIAALLTTLGCGLLILPGVFLAVIWWFTVPLIADRRMDFWPAMELSRKVATKHWFTVFGLLLLTTLVGIAGVLACGIGIFVTIPLAIGATYYAYEDFFGSRPS